MSSSSSTSPSSSEDMAGSIGIPQLILCAIVAALVYRYVLAPSQTPGAPGSANRHRPRAAVSQEAIESLRAMFPQISVAAIRWDLEKNGGSVEATTEKILTDGFLPEPPAPAIRQTQRTASPLPAHVNTQAGSRGGTGRPPATASSPSSLTGITAGHTDLITRYNLHSRLEAYRHETPVGQSAVSIKKNDKASLFLRGRERRDMMILEARNKMEGMLRR